MSQDEGDCFEGLDLNQPWVMESCRLNCVHHPEKVFKYVGHFGCRHAIPRLEFRLGYSSHSLEEEDLNLANTPLQDVDEDTAHLMYEVFLSSGDYAWIRRLADIANTTNNMEVIRYVDECECCSANKLSPTWTVRNRWRPQSSCFTLRRGWLTKWKETG